MKKDKRENIIGILSLLSIPIMIKIAVAMGEIESIGEGLKTAGYILGIMVLIEGLLWIPIGIHAIILGIQGKLPPSNTRNWLRWY